MSPGDGAMELAPLLPWWLLVALGTAAAGALGFAIARRAAGVWWRALAAAVVLAALVNPSLLLEDREGLPDVALVVVDRSPSQDIGQRRNRAEVALVGLRAKLGGDESIELLVVEAGGGALLENGGTRLIAPLAGALAEVPRGRLAGVIVITDGQVHDAATADRLGLSAPVHVLLTGEREEADRRLIVEEAPSFAIVGRPAEIAIRVEDAGIEASARPAAITVRRDGALAESLLVPIGRDHTFRFTLDRAGPSVIEIEVESGPSELSLANNRVVVVVNGVRHRLKVLLVSGEPHPGGRTWRRLLKSDPSVDLIHFTILRPPEKQDRTPLRELSLITFPVRELFEVKLDEFDLIIFDRYRRRGVLSLRYMTNIVEYVRKGGGLLVAVGPSFASPLSLYNTPLGLPLPGAPTGDVIEGGYRPTVTALGRRHPITAGLRGDNPNGAPRWGRWFRQIEAKLEGGIVLMEGVEDAPLVILDRYGEGRVAQIMSDHIWLWARDFEGGGPQAELLRRLAHWLMKEPELEEDRLDAKVVGSRLVITRRGLTSSTAPVTVTWPSGREAVVELLPATGGREQAGLAIEEPGLYRVSDGTRAAFAAAGPVNPLETADMRSTPAALEPLAATTGGAVVWLSENPTPATRRIHPGRDASGRVGGRAWVGLWVNGDYIVRDLSRAPLVPALAVLLTALGGFMLAWRREGR
jgi:hypothetical protein